MLTAAATREIDISFPVGVALFIAVVLIVGLACWGACRLWEWLWDDERRANKR